MPSIAAAFALLCALPSVTVSPASVAARGKQEAIVTIGVAGMYHLSARSASGTACEIVDHLRGPFESSGVVGKRNCELDLLLDSGSYKLRLESPAKGKGKVALEVKPFAELNPGGVRLDERQSAELALKPGQQASYWIHLDQPRYVNLLVAGRSAGVAQLWRNGQWVEELPASRETLTPRPGQPVWLWHLRGNLEAGDYLLVAYGARPQQWTRGSEDNALYVANGFDQGPTDRTYNFTIPSWGRLWLEIGGRPHFATLALDQAPAAATLLEIWELAAKSSELVGAGGNCSIAAKAVVPACATSTSGENRHLLVITGEPGSRGQLQWAPLPKGLLADGEYLTSSDLEFKVTSSGRYLVGLHDVPTDNDAAPLSCVLEQQYPRQEWTTVATDALRISGDRPFSRQFNLREQGYTLWFELRESGEYHIASAGETQAVCELYQGSNRLTKTDPKAKRCDLKLKLGPGQYELNLFNGQAGIEKLVIDREGGLFKSVVDLFSKKAGAPAEIKPTPGKSGCRFADVELKPDARYRIRSSRLGAVQARGLVLRPLPLLLESPLPVVVDGNSEVRLPLATGRMALVRGIGAGSCGLRSGGAVGVRDGVCTVPELSRADELILANRGVDSITVAVSRPKPVPPRPALASYAPKFAPLPAIAVGKPLYLGFGRAEARSLLFEVAEAGLYHVTTEGLLATECRLRTPIVPRLASDRGGGRGRNCLLAGYLRPGRYLATVTTVGQSKGRAGVLLSRRPATKGPALRADGEVFYRVAAGDLIQQDLRIGRSGRHALDSSGQGVRLQCRLDDRAGWPLVKVPTDCRATHDLAKGSYRWSQLPLTVESMRRTQLARVRPALVLRGAKKAHVVDVNRWYDAELGGDGRDEFKFTLAADLPVRLALTNGMQGRLYRVVGNQEELIETVPPGELPPEEVEDEGGEGEMPTEGEVEELSTEGEGGEPGTEGDGAAVEGEGEAVPDEGAAPGDDPATDGSGGDGEYEDNGDPLVNEDGAPTPAYDEPATRRPHRAANADNLAIDLKAGNYKLVTEHSRGDVAIAYRLRVTSDLLAPGLRQEVSVPGTATVRMPTAGMMLLATSGQTDVRCRLFDGNGALLAESSDYGADWNCRLVEPLPAGDYQLVLEAQNQRAGQTTIKVAVPVDKKVDALLDGAKLKTANQALVAALPKAAADVVQELHFRSNRPFACALERSDGRVLARENDVRHCQLLVHPADQAFNVRLWTRGSWAEITASVLARPVAKLHGHTVNAGQAGLVEIERPGRYRTADNVWCRPAADPGLLLPCGPSAPLEPGALLVSTVGQRDDLKLDLDEQVVELAAGDNLVVRQQLDQRRLIERQRSGEQSLHLVEVRVPFGEDAAPACRLDGGVAQQQAYVCHAASSATRESLLRLWAMRSKPLAATVSRIAAVLPARAEPLAPGQRAVSWNGPVGRYALPAAPFQLDATLPPQTWAVQLDDQGRAIDFCPPAAALDRCLLAGRGGELVLQGSGAHQFEARLLLVDGARPVVALRDLVESMPRQFGQLQLVVAPADRERLVEVDGALRCTVSRDDGSRIGGCRASIPPRQGATVLVSHQPGALRAVLFAPGSPNVARWNALLPLQQPPPLAEALATPLRPGSNDHAIEIKQRSLIDLRADSGVCALFDGTRLLALDGLDAGCTVQRLLEPGRYRVMVRPFADVPASGRLSWTAQPVPALVDGVGPEQWIAPGAARYYSFRTASAGAVGLGLQVDADRLECNVLDVNHRPLGQGCQQYLKLPAGNYLLAVRAPPDLPPQRFRPVLLGLKGSQMDVPEEYLRDFFQRLGGQP